MPRLPPGQSGLTGLPAAPDVVQVRRGRRQGWKAGVEGRNGRQAGFLLVSVVRLDCVQRQMGSGGQLGKFPSI